MKKIFAFIAILGLLSFGINAYAQDEVAAENSATEEQVEGENGGEEATMEEEAPVEEEVVESTPAAAEEESVEEAEISGLNAYVKKYFIEGGPTFMSFVLICLILGLALCIERIVYLNMSTTNTKKLLASIEEALSTGGVEAAKEVCRNTSGPVASIFYQGLDRSSGSIEEVEKSVEQFGGVQMGLLERGLSWISLFIALAPMLGFLGTVIGMIKAFDDIQNAGTMSATVVAGGIKVALITTVSGLIVAIILQIFYNYILSKVDGIVLDMEDSSIQLVDMLYKHQLMNK